MLRLSLKDPQGERRFATERYEVLIGQREGVDLKLDDPAVSRNHCLLRVEGDRVRLVDLGTDRGTHVGGRRIEHAFLGPGSEFTVGSTAVRIEAFEGPPRPLPPPPVVTGAASRPLRLEDVAVARAAAPGPPAASALPARAPTPVERTHPSDFAREVRALLRQTPWYGISLLVHLAFLLLLSLFDVGQPRTAPTPRIEATLAEELAPPEDVEGMAEPDPSEIEPAIEPELPLDLEAPDGPPKQQTPGDLDLEFEPATPPDALGMGRGRPILKIAALPTKDVTGAAEALQAGDIAGEHGRAKDAVEQRLGGGIRAVRRKVTQADIVVVRGDFDSIEHVLDSYEWAYTLIDREDLVRRSFPAAKLLFINCGRKPAAPEKIVTVVKNFVQRGGWVVTSDWSVDPYLTLAFPDKVKLIDPKRRQPDTTVTVHPVSTHSILDGVFSRRAQSTWWLEETSKLVDVGMGVDVLVSSEDLEHRYGSRVVVFLFEFGQGRVLHLLGHFYQKDGNRMGLVGMHMLINNVILERFQ